jgi:hypothetical protein
MKYLPLFSPSSLLLADHDLYRDHSLPYVSFLFYPFFQRDRERGHDHENALHENDCELVQ